MTSSAKSKPHIPAATSKYAFAFEGRAGRPETKSDLYVLLEPHTRRLDDMPTVLRRRVPAEIAIDSGLVLPEPQCGHLNLSAVFFNTSLRLCERPSVHLIIGSLLSCCVLASSAKPGMLLLDFVSLDSNLAFILTNRILNP